MSIWRLRHGQKVWFKYVKGPHEGPNRSARRASLHKGHSGGRVVVDGQHLGTARQRTEHNWRRRERMRVAKMARRQNR